MSINNNRPNLPIVPISRETIHAVSVFQGHQDAVSSAVFVTQPATDLIVSGSDDRSMKVAETDNIYIVIMLSIIYFLRFGI